MNYSKYTRSFIILDDKKSDFRNTNENIKGHVKIELRNNQGTLKCNVQNLKYYEDARYLYKLYFFGKKADNTIFTNTGTLYIDKQGRGEHFFKFNPSDLDGEGNELYDFSILAIIAHPNKDIVEDDTLFPVLTGYLSKESRSESHSDDNLINLNSRTKEEELQEEVSDIKTGETAEFDVNAASAVQNIEEKVTEPEESDAEVSSPEANPEDLSADADLKESSEDVSSPEAKPVEDQEEKEIPINTTSEKPGPADVSAEKGTFNTPDSKSALKPLSKKVFDTSGYFSNYVRAVSTNLEKVLSFYNRTEPFEQDRIGCKWWKIINLMSIPFANTSYLQGYPEHMRPYNMNYFDPREFCPSCHDLIYKYQHYIFGINREKNNSAKYYYYGIPGRYMKEEQPDNGKSGFQYWQPLQGTDKKIGDYGYWIIGINSQTGQFEIPIEE